MPTESCINSRLNSIHFWVECLQTFELQNTFFSRKMHFLQTWTAYLLKWATMTSFCHLKNECQDFKCTKFKWTTRCRCKLKLLANKLAASCLCRRSADVVVQFWGLYLASFKTPSSHTMIWKSWACIIDLTLNLHECRYQKVMDIGQGHKKYLKHKH